MSRQNKEKGLRVLRAGIVIGIILLPLLWFISCGVMIKADHDADMAVIDHLQVACDKSTINDSLSECKLALKGMEELGLENGSNANWILQDYENEVSTQYAIILSFIERFEELISIDGPMDGINESIVFQQIKSDIKYFINGPEGSDHSDIHVSCAYQKSEYPFWDFYFCFGWLIGIALIVIFGFFVNLLNYKIDYEC